MKSLFFLMLAVKRCCQESELVGVDDCRWQSIPSPRRAGKRISSSSRIRDVVQHVVDDIISLFPGHAVESRDVFVRRRAIQKMRQNGQGSRDCSTLFVVDRQIYSRTSTSSTCVNLSLNNGSTLGLSPTPNCYRCKRVCVVEDERRSQTSIIPELT